MDDMEGRRGRQQNTIARQQRGTYSAYGEKLDYSYYDTIPLAAGTTDYSFFQTPIGGGAVAKTISQTNMTLGGQIPQGQKFRVRALKVAYMSHALKAAADEQTLYNWIAQAVIRIFITGKDAIYSKSLQEVLGNCMLWTQQDLAAAGAESKAGYAKFVGIDVLNVPVTLAALTNFEVRLSTPTAIPGGATIIADLFRVTLSGILRRQH